jgi:hypothetical protein
MDHPLVVVLLTIAVLVVLKFIVILALAGGDLSRFGLSIKAYFRVLGDPKTAARIAPLLGPPEPEKARKLSGEPLRLLNLLQREGRLLDFLLEDIEAATDEQIGAGVRELHRKAQAVVKEHLTLEPVLSHQEGDEVQVAAGFDPSAIRLTGNVTGQPPFKGVLKHHGWRVKDYKLPPPPEGQDELVVAQADVELP